jgi:hypothetical protein
MVLPSKLQQSTAAAIDDRSGLVRLAAMEFTKRLHEPITRGEVTCSVRIWQRPHVKIAGRYRLGEGFIEVTSIRRIRLADVTPELARRSGFLGVVDLLKVAKHGPGENVYLIEFKYHAERTTMQR